jgi:flagellar biosynthesis chaperone FliJ
MKDHSQYSPCVRIVLKAAQQELEHTSNYVERISALQNTAEILKMLTAYRSLGEEIEHTLSVSGNINNQLISQYVRQLNMHLKDQIQNMESALHH